MISLFDSQFWRDEKSLMWAALSGLYLDAFFAGVEGGTDILPADLQTLINFDSLNTSAIEFANRYRYELISGINDTTTKQVQEAMELWIRSGDPLSVLEDMLFPIFGEARANMIAVTEITRIFAQANMAAWNSTGFVSSKVWMTSQDDRVCPICRPMAGKVVALNNAFPSSVGGGFNNPPIHPRCRCWLQPVVDVDKVQEQIERILRGQ